MRPTQRSAGNDGLATMKSHRAGPPPASQIRRWIDAARDGSDEAVSRLLETYRPYLLLQANQELDAELRRKVAASDLVQDTLLAAYEKLPDFRGHSEPEIRLWLRSILDHRLGDQVRKFRTSKKRDLKREVHLTGDDSAQQPLRELALDTPLPVERAAAREEFELLEDSLARLSPRDQQVINLRNRDRKTFEEIGGEMSISADAARMLWTRAIKKLKAEFDHGSRASAR